MRARKVFAHLTDGGVEVNTPEKQFFVSRRDDIRGAVGCPIDFLTTALSS